MAALTAMTEFGVGEEVGGGEERSGCGEIRVRLHGEGHEAVILGDVAFQNIGART